MSVPTHLAQGRGINQVDMPLHQLGEGGFAPVLGVTLKQFGVVHGFQSIAPAQSKTGQRKFGCLAPWQKLYLSFAVNDFLFARSQMAMSLAFHIIFAVVGIGMPVLMAVSEGLFLRTNNPIYLEFSNRWARGTASLFAVGTVSGTVLSFALG